MIILYDRKINLWAIFIVAAQRVVALPPAWALPRSLLEMQNFTCHPRPTDSESALNKDSHIKVWQALNCTIVVKSTCSLRPGILKGKTSIGVRRIQYESSSTPIFLSILSKWVLIFWASVCLPLKVPATMCTLEGFYENLYLLLFKKLTEHPWWAGTVLKAQALWKTRDSSPACQMFHKDVLSMDHKQWH